MRTGEIQHDVEIAQRLALRILAHDAKPHATGIGLHIDRADLRRLRQTVGRHRLGHCRQDFAHIRVVDAQHCGTVERQVLHKIEESLA